MICIGCAHFHFSFLFLLPKSKKNRWPSRSSDVWTSTHGPSVILRRAREGRKAPPCLQTASHARISSFAQPQIRSTLPSFGASLAEILEGFNITFRNLNFIHSIPKAPAILPHPGRWRERFNQWFIFWFLCIRASSGEGSNHFCTLP